MQIKQQTNATLLACIMLLVFSSCSEKKSKTADADNKSTGSSFDLAAAKKTVEDGNQSLMDLLKKGDSTGFAAMYCSDAKAMAPGGPAAAGRGAIQSMIGSLVQMGLTNLKLTTTDVWGSEALIGEEGTYTFTGGDGKQVDNGKYIVLWKMEDGKWKLFRDIWNTDVPAPTGK